MPAAVTDQGAEATVAVLTEEPVSLPSEDQLADAQASAQLASLFIIASADEHPIIDLNGTVVFQFAIYVLMALIATKLLFRPYLAMREAREEGILGARDEAERMAAEADGQLADYETKLAAARKKAHAEQLKIRAEAAAHEQQVTGKARAEAIAAIDTAKAKVRQETEAARAELLPKAEELANQIVAKLLGRSVN